MAKKQENKDDSEQLYSVKKKKKLHSKKTSEKMATNEEIIKYCIDNNLLYALMTWLEIDLGVSIVRSGIIKSFKTSLGTDGYYFVSLDPDKKKVIKEMDISADDYDSYYRSLVYELSAYLSESESKPASAKRMFGRYVYNKMNKMKHDDIDIEAFVHHIKLFKDKLGI